MMRSVGTLTRADLAETINRKLGFSRAESLDYGRSDPAPHVRRAGERRERQDFGLRHASCCATRRERVGRNPKTGVEVPITPRRVLTFRASQMLKDRIAEG